MFDGLECAPAIFLNPVDGFGDKAREHIDEIRLSNAVVAMNLIETLDDGLALRAVRTESYQFRHDQGCVVVTLAGAFFEFTCFVQQP